MKGAAIGHAKQRMKDGRYVGITEPGIIAAESPNPIVNQLVIMPDIEKRLEAFVRIAHGIVVFPGGVGTLEELLFLLGILMHPKNKDVLIPLILAGPKSSMEYFGIIDEFIGATLGVDAQHFYRIEIGDPARVAQTLADSIGMVKEVRHASRDAYYFNWRLNIEHGFQQPFVATHENMALLKIHRDQGTHELAYHLRRAFSGLVAGNVKEHGLRAIEEHGPFIINGESKLLAKMDELLASFVTQSRMKLAKDTYQPCYRLIL